MINKILFFLVLLNLFVKGQDFWELTNGPYSGAFSVSFIDNRIYAVDHYDNVFYSSDAGQKWHYIKKNNFSRHGFIKAVTGNSKGMIFEYSDVSGLLVTPDFGNSWQVLSSRTFFDNISLDVINDSLIYIKTVSGKLYRWSEINNDFNELNEYPFSDVVFKGDTIFALNDKIVFSVDHGDTWMTLIDSIPGYGKPDFTTLGISDDKTLYVKNKKGQLLVIKNDLSFAIILEDVNQYVVFNDGRIAAVVNYTSFVVKEKNSDIWEERFNNGSQIYIQAANSEGYLYCTSYPMGYMSKDFGKTWNEFGIPSSIVNDLYSLNNSLYAVTTDGILSVSEDKGNTWSTLLNGPTGGTVSTLAISDSLILVANNNPGIFRTTDKGATWTVIKDLVPKGNGSLYVQKLVKTRGGLVYAIIFGGLAISADSGLTWNWSSRIPNCTEITAITVTDNAVFIARNGNSIYKSIDKGTTWTEIYRNDNTRINTLTINTYGDIFAGTFDGGVLYSSDEGKTFKNIFPGDRKNSINDIIPDKYGSVYAALDSVGVFKSSDRGNSWKFFGTGINNSLYMKLAIDDDGYLYAGTNRSSIYRSKFKVTGNDQEGLFWLIPNYKLYQNYPNPFNSSTLIKFYVPDQPGLYNVVLKVYNVLGEEIATLLNSKEAGGEYQVQFRSSSLPSGVYFYQLEIDGFCQTRKMLLLK